MALSYVRLSESTSALQHSSFLCVREPESTDPPIADSERHFNGIRFLINLNQLRHSGVPIMAHHAKTLKKGGCYTSAIPDLSGFIQWKNLNRLVPFLRKVDWHCYRGDMN
jgi:hypothetical protein